MIKVILKSFFEINSVCVCVCSENFGFDKAMGGRRSMCGVLHCRVTMVEGTVNALLEEDGRVVGVAYHKKGSEEVEVCACIPHTP